jgi:glutamate-1-semialdehyde 2,1-aminomutase
MQLIAPSGPVYQAGTLSGNPLAMTAGLETLKAIEADARFYPNLAASCEYLYEGITNNLRELKLDYTLNRVGSMFTLFFTGEKVVDFDSAKTSDTKRFTAYFNRMLESGVYLPPSQFEACFVSAAHSQEDFDATIKASYLALKNI